ncbi:MAG: hypothetical protein HQM04_10705 [Magnetococcales bacterium]|nr:hypothetical protein [Magnetococcales bacterium]MBF0115494.1 hypothetical protein [Magnetococcales bacterium]
MTGGPQQPRSCLSRLIPHKADPEQQRREGWHSHGILVVAIDDRRLSWPEQEMVKHLAKKLFGQQAAKEVQYGR